jgi:hypothetical protein
MNKFWLIGIVFFAPSWAFAFQSPTMESVHSVTGFYSTSTSAPVIQVPAQTDTGMFNIDTDELTIKSIEGLRFAVPNDGFEPQVVPYIYHGPYYGLNYASYGYWLIVRKTPYAWGLFAAGSGEDFSLPTAKAATYCGFWDAWVNNPPSHGLDSMGEGPVLIQTSFQHTMFTKATINTFYISEIGETTSAAIAIEGNGTSTVTFRTYGPNGVSLNGGLATALVEFYGPGAIQLSATFSGPWRGQRISGALLAQLVPGNPGTCR